MREIVAVHPAGMTVNETIIDTATASAIGETIGVWRQRVIIRALAAEVIE